MPAPAVPLAPWNVNAPDPCPICDGAGCQFCGWCGSELAFHEEANKATAHPFAPMISTICPN